MAVEVHEDQPLVEPGAAWPRQLWLPMISHPYAIAQSINPAQIQFGQIGRATRQIPTDFTAFTRFDMVMYPSANANYNLQTAILAGQCTELWNTHVEGHLLVVPMVINVLTCLDLTATHAAILALLVPGDNIQVTVNNQTGNNVYVYGIDMRYT